MVDRTDAHIAAWAIALILFVIALILQKNGNKKGFKISQMILRLFYILILVTGGLLFFKHQSIYPMQYGLKLLAGLIVIAMLEMILIRTSKGKGTGVLWTVFVLALAATLYLGFWLPIGFHPFA